MRHTWGGVALLARAVFIERDSMRALVARLVLAATAVSAVAALGCTAPAADVELVSGSEQAATTTARSYVFQQVATFPRAGYSLTTGPASSGAIVLAQDAYNTRPRSYVWDGAALTATANSPHYAQGVFAYDEASRATYFLESSGEGKYEALWKWDGASWSQLFTAKAEAVTHALFVGPGGQVGRLSSAGVERFRPAISYSNPKRWESVAPPPSGTVYCAAYDAARHVVVARTSAGGTVEGPAAGASTWRSVAASPAVAVSGTCSAAVWDPTARAVVMRHWGSSGSIFVTWDGAKSETLLAKDAPLNGSMSGMGPGGAIAQAVGVDAVNAALFVATRADVTTPNALVTAEHTDFSIYATEQATMSLGLRNPDRDPLTFELVGAPAGVTIDEKAGALVWTPELADEGAHAFTVRIGDGEATVDVPVTVDVKVMRYADLPADVSISLERWGNGPATWGMDRRNAHALYKCAFTGKNPGVVRGRCSVQAGICAKYSFQTSGCPNEATVSLGASGVLSANGSFSERRDEYPYTSSGSSFPRWTSRVSAALRPDGTLCASHEYSDRQGRRASGTTCP